MRYVIAEHLTVVYHGAITGVALVSGLIVPLASEATNSSAAIWGGAFLIANTFITLTLNRYFKSRDDRQKAYEKSKARRHRPKLTSSDGASSGDSHSPVPKPSKRRTDK